MTENGVAPIFAGMLGELEDVAMELTARQSALAKELEDVSAELDRVEAVRAAMTGKTTKKPTRRRSYGSGGYQLTDEAKARVEKITEWAKDRGEFQGGDAAEAIGMNPQRIGPIIAGMVRRGELTANGAGKARRYTLA